MKIGYIEKYDLNLNPHLEGPFMFREATFARRINSRGDKVYSKLLALRVDYEDIVFTAKMMKENPKCIIVREPFLLDDELRERVIRWVEWANKADPSEYDPFAKQGEENQRRCS